MIAAGTFLPEASAITTPKAVTAQVEKVKIIATDHGGRFVDLVDAETRHDRYALRKQVFLNFFRHIELVVDDSFSSLSSSNESVSMIEAI